MKMNRTKLVERMLDSNELQRVESEMTAQNVQPGGKVIGDTARAGSSVRRRPNAPVVIPQNEI